MFSVDNLGVDIFLRNRLGDIRVLLSMVLDVLGDTASVHGIPGGFEVGSVTGKNVQRKYAYHTY